MKISMKVKVIKTTKGRKGDKTDWWFVRLVHGKTGDLNSKFYIRKADAARLARSLAKRINNYPDDEVVVEIEK
jgi:hypothetical protein